MFALGLLCEIYQRDLSIIEKQIAHIFQKKPAKVTELNIELVKRGIAWARENLGFQFHVETIGATLIPECDNHIARVDIT